MFQEKKTPKYLPEILPEETFTNKLDIMFFTEQRLKNGIKTHFNEEMFLKCGIYH